MLNLCAGSCEVKKDSSIYDFAIEVIEINIENTMIEEEIRTLLGIENVLIKARIFHFGLNSNF